MNARIAGFGNRVEDTELAARENGLQCGREREQETRALDIQFPAYEPTIPGLDWGMM